MGKNVKTDPDRVRKNKGVPLLGEVPLLENLRYLHFTDTKISDNVQIACSILAKGNQQYHTNNAADYKKTLILISTMLHFLDP